MKYFKNVSKMKLSLGNIYLLPDGGAMLDETSVQVKPFVLNGYLKEAVKEVGAEMVKLVPAPETSEPVASAESVASKPEETSQVETGSSRGSLAAQPATTPGGKIMPKDAEVNRFAFTDDQGSVVSKGMMPGQGNEKPMAQFMTEALTVGQKDLGSITDNSGTAVSAEPKKKL